MARTDTQVEIFSPEPAIILVEPQLGENIGMAARAMANFGLGELWLVNPRDGWPSARARAASRGADRVIDSVKTCTNLAEAVANVNFLLATTARPRDNFKPVYGLGEAMVHLRAHHRAGHKTGILFGRECWGLTNEEIALADGIITFPVNPAFSSLNVAQAVLLISYEWMKTSQIEGEFPVAPARRPATKEHLESLILYLDQALCERGYFRTEAKKPKGVDKLRALFTRPGFSMEELSVFRGILSCLERFSPKRSVNFPEDRARKIENE